ncbi:MAG: asparagine synthetase B [Micavibrio sp.]|nr:MAG: asparagine synthetase B [Micavibrio sp.]
MCGITGIYSAKDSQDRQALDRLSSAMTATLSHRGPDGTGTWQDPDLPLVFGHHRLAVLDLSELGHQPMESESGRYVICYNGEVFRYLEIRKELEKSHVTFRGRSDTEVILAAIDHWGLNLALQKIEGMFAFALWDRKDKQLHLVRDRLGKKPLYVGWAGQSLVFTSELKALHTHPDFKPVVNRKALTAFMRYGYTPAPLCIYEGVWSLPAGFRMSICADLISPGSDLENFMESYWHHLRALEEQQQKYVKKSDEETINEFEKLLTTCTKDRMISDVPLGAFLSGGVDSSSVVALMQKISSNPVKTYSIGFEEQGYDEAGHAKKIAAHLGTDHHEHYLSAKDALDVIPKLPDIYDEPFADISQIPTYLISKYARENVTVALSGDGGDEMLGGYNRHFIGPKLWHSMRFMPQPVRRMLASIIGGTSIEKWNSLAPSKPQFGERMHKVGSILGMNTQEDIYQKLISQWDAPADLVIGGSEPLTPLTDPEWQPEDMSFAARMMYWDALSYLSNDILVKVDRASMATSLEIRAPLLDRRIYDYVWTLPENMKIRNGQGKWLLKQVLHRHVPKELFERPKQGFSVPIDSWLRGELRDWAENLLDEKRLDEEGYLNTKIIRDIWEHYLDGHGNHAGQLWTVLMFQAWKERWL